MHMRSISFVYGTDARTRRLREDLSEPDWLPLISVCSSLRLKKTTNQSEKKIVTFESTSVPIHTVNEVETDRKEV